ncbi:non-ribosomal peptide synthetase [Kibdelosporangium aridum]|uniref:non-ribosomal peptide synthetase n=1 Tax=Kibdelosporangium aridum TaxID=2030 RepID=UPI0035EB3D8C
MAQQVSRPLTAKEEAVWLLRYLPVDHGVSNEALCMFVDGRLDRALLTEALRHVTARHEAIRTVFPDTADGPVAVVLPASDVDVEVQTAESHPDTANEDALLFCRKPFDMTTETGLRVGCFAVGSHDLMCFAFHHLCSDAASMSVVVDELTTIYDALVDGRPVPAALLEPGRSAPVAPADEGGIQFWREHVAGADPAQQRLAFGRPDPDVPRMTGAGYHHELSDAAQRALPELRRTLRTTENIVMLSAYQLALVLHGAGPDVVVGTRLAGRELDERTAVGWFASTVPLRTRVDVNGTFRELVAMVGANFLAGMTHRNVSFEALRTTRDPETAWRTPLFRHVFNYGPWQAPTEITCGGFRARMWVPEYTQSRHDIEMMVDHGGGTAWLRTIYSTEIHDEADIARFVRRYDHLLAHLTSNIDRPMTELRWWTEEDERVVAAANDTARMSGAPLLPAAVTNRAMAAPSAPAVVDGDREYSYAELVSAAAVVRDRLRAAGVVHGDRVGIFAERGAPLAAAVLGTWAVGAAYLPVYVEHPANLVDHQLADGGVKVLLADRALPVGCVPACPVLAMGDPFSSDQPCGELPLRTTPVEPDELAYVMYTSGSTGRPKGVAIDHGNIANQIWHFVDELGAGPDDAVLWLATFSFDIATLELFLPLAVGGRVVVAPSTARTDPALAVRLIERHQVDVVQSTPTVLRLIAPIVGDVLAGTRVLTGGEKIARADAEALLDARCRLFNVYGPTETTIWSTSAELGYEDLDAIPIGRPVSNATVYVRGVAGVHLPPGVFGEICVAGAGVGSGYINRPELTAEKFVTDLRYGPNYRTGDVGRWRHDGVLELAGRVDRQVKIRGNRVELDGIEAILSQCPGVHTAAVIYVEGAEHTALHGFIQAQSGGDRDSDTALVAAVWNYARENLPGHALPSEITVLDAFPLTPNGKTDWQALNDLLSTKSATTTKARSGSVDPSDETLALLVELWREMLGDPGLGPEDNFFLNGGHSLLGVRMLAKLGEHTGETPELTSLLNAPTPAELAALLRSTPTRTGSGR